MTEQDERRPDESVEMARRVNVALNRSGAEALANLTERTDMDRVALVNRALQVLDWADREQRSGNVLIVRSPAEESETAVLIL